MQIANDYNLQGRIIKDNDVYVVKDNMALKDMITSHTILYPEQCTGGHSHEGQEEIYIFTHGRGKIQIDEDIYFASPGDVYAIPAGAFHKVFNTSVSDNMSFLAIFNGSRNH